MQIKTEAITKGILHVGGSVATLLLVIPQSQWETPKTIVAACVIGALSALGYISKTFGRYQSVASEAQQIVATLETIAPQYSAVLNVAGKAVSDVEETKT